MKRSLLTDQDVGGTEVSPSAAGSDAQEFGAETAEAVVDMESLLSATDEETGLSEDVATERLREFGRNELPDIRVPKWKVFVSHFTGIMPCMIILAITLEGLLQEWPDFCTLLTLLILNGSIGFWEDMRAGDAVAALKASLKPEATVKRDGVWRKIDASLLVPGDLVGLGAGSNIPADCRVGKGMEIQVDQAALTGESLPVHMNEGDGCKMGSTVVAGEVEAIVMYTGINTSFGKTAALIGSTHDVGNFQKVTPSSSSSSSRDDQTPPCPIPARRLPHPCPPPAPSLPAPCPIPALIPPVPPTRDAPSPGHHQDHARAPLRVGTAGHDRRHLPGHP